MSSTTGEQAATPGSSTTGGGVNVGNPGEAAIPTNALAFDMTEKALSKAMEDISSVEILAFVTLLEATTTDKIDVSIFILFEFQGFDPNAIIRKLITINKHYRETKKDSTQTLSVLKEDVMFMIAANLYMGNLQKKSLSRRSAVGRMKVQELVVKYAMKIGTTGAGIASDIITFPRVCNSFPVLACRMASVLPSKDFLTGDFKTRYLPKFMRIPAFGCFLHGSLENRTRKFLQQAVCAYSCDQTMTIHSGEQKKKKNKKDIVIMTALDAFGMQWDFITVTSDSPVPKLEMKKAMLTEFRVESLYETLHPIVKTFRLLTGDSEDLLTKGDYESDIRGYINSSSSI